MTAGRTMLDLVDVPAVSTIQPVDALSPLYLTSFAKARERSYTHVIVGGGCVGTTVADALLRRDRKARVLVLEQGDFLLPEHVQDVAPVFQPLMTTAVATPWSYVDGPDQDGYGLTPQVPFLGGRALFWSTWIPQPAPDQMEGWPESVLDGLAVEWPGAQAVLGATSAKDMGPEFDVLHPRLRRTIVEAARQGRVPGLLRYPDESAIEGRLACAATRSVLHYRKFAPVGLLLELARRQPDRLNLVTGCQVEGLEVTESEVRAMRTNCGELDLRGATLILALGTVETTGLLLGSAADRISPLTGRNLGGHVATWFTMRIPREHYPDLPDRLQTSVLYLDGAHRDRQFHIHFMAASNPDPSSALDDLYRLIPDSFDQDFLAELADPRYLGFMIHALGELRGVKSDDPPSSVTVRDGKTYVHIAPTPADMDLWMAMDQTCGSLVDLLARGASPEYWDPSTEHWTGTLPAARHKKLLVHETGTLWMGESAGTSVTDCYGRVRGLDRTYAAGPAIFPSCGSWNPTLTAVALGNRLAAHLALATSNREENR
jgi:choline dehydrogenase-like flavoprotein